jgi:hypothetical protein
MKKVWKIYWPWPNLAKVVIAIGSLYKNIFLDSMLVSAIIGIVLDAYSKTHQLGIIREGPRLRKKIKKRM